jgi:hypothetical protein
VISLVLSNMASSTQLHSAYSKLDAASSSDPSFSATVMQLVALVQTWQPASRDAQSMQFAGQVMDLLDAKVREHDAPPFKYC